MASKKKKILELLKKIKANGKDNVKENMINELVKLRREENDEKSSGLSDKIDLNPEGELKIELTDEDGNVIDTVAEENLVVNTSFDILLKGMSGQDFKVYLNPELTSEYKSYQSACLSGGRTGETQPDAPQEDDIEWVLNTEPKYICRKTYTGSRTPPDAYYSYNLDNLDSVVSEILFYPKEINDGSINFMGIGTSQLRYKNNDSEIFNYTNSAGEAGSWSTVKDSNYKGGSVTNSIQSGDHIEFKTKSDVLNLFLQYNPEGALCKVLVDDQEVKEVSTLNSDEKEEILDISLPNNDDEKTVKIKNSGKVTSSQSEAKLMFLGLEISDYDVTTKKLANEVMIEKEEVDVFETYKTTGDAPYTFYLDLKNPQNELALTEDESKFDVEISVNGEEYEQITTTPTDPDSKKFKIDSDGQVTLPHEAKGVAATYKLTNTYATDYHRALINKPNEKDKKYPIYNYDGNEIKFEAEFKPHNPKQAININELALLNLPLKDNVKNVDSGSFNYEKAFSITGVDNIRKAPDNGLKVVWTIRLSR